MTSKYKRPEMLFTCCLFPFIFKSTKTLSLSQTGTMKSPPVLYFRWQGRWLHTLVRGQSITDRAGVLNPIIRPGAPTVATVDKEPNTQSHLTSPGHTTPNQDMYFATAGQHIGTTWTVRLEYFCMVHSTQRD